METCASLLVGHVMHRRLRPVVNAFVYPVFYIRLPVRNLEAGNCSIFSVDRNNLLSFHRRDHGPRDGSCLLAWITDLLRANGLPDDGEIVLQTFPRVLGYVFNPVSFWFCHAADGTLVAVLAEVNNTFGGRHAYLLHDQGRPLHDGAELQAAKCFHVSPFCRVEGAYRFRFHLDRAQQVARIDYADAEGDLLLTSISGRARAWTAGNLWRAFLRMPLLTPGVILRIHWQAFRLWCKGVPFFGARPPAARHLYEETGK